MTYPRPLQVNMFAAWAVIALVMVSAAAARRVFMSFLANLSAVCLLSAVFPDLRQGQQSAAGCENDRAFDDNGCFLNAHETVLRCGAYVGL
jgi:hypothetical protein